MDKNSWDLFWGGVGKSIAMVSVELDCSLFHPQVGKNDSHKLNGLLGNLNKRTYLPPSESEGRSVVSDSLWPRGLYSPWNSPGQNVGLGSLSLLQGIFPTQGLNPVSCIAGGFSTSWATGEAQEY